MWIVVWQRCVDMARARHVTRFFNAVVEVISRREQIIISRSRSREFQDNRSSSQCDGQIHSVYSLQDEVTLHK